MTPWLRRLLRLAAFGLWLWPAMALAQANVEAGGPPDGGSAPSAADVAAERAARLAEIAASGPVRTDAAARESQPAEPPPGIAFDAETEAAYQRAWQAYYDYRTDGYAQRKGVFAWQDVSTKITFFVVIGLVLAGVYFAAVQFHVGMRSGREPGEAGEVEFSVKGFKVRSPVLGVIVLSISLAFFYLYLVYVYPIQNVF